MFVAYLRTGLCRKQCHAEKIKDLCPRSARSVTLNFESIGRIIVWERPLWERL